MTSDTEEKRDSSSSDSSGEKMLTLEIKRLEQIEADRHSLLDIGIARRNGIAECLPVIRALSATIKRLEGRMCLVCGAGSPCTTSPDACTFDPSPIDAARAFLKRAHDAEDTIKRLETPVAGAIGEISAERQRQVEVEGWNAAHDDEHTRGQLARAAAAYAFKSTVSPEERSNSDNNDKAWCLWPWARKWWKPSDRRRNLVKAGALILAEIERLDRAALSLNSVETRDMKP